MFDSCCIKMVSATAWLCLGHKLDKIIHVFVRFYVREVEVTVKLARDDKKEKSHDLCHVVKIYCSAYI